MNLLELENNLLSDIRKSALTLVAHDAGGANVLAAFVRNLKLTPARLELAGPALQIFKSLQKQEESEVVRTKITLASTGWYSNFEKNQIRKSLDEGQRTIVVLDHWTNFEQRLQLKHGPIHVKEIITFDEEARLLASNAFPNSMIYLFPNYYLVDQCQQILEMRKRRTTFKYEFLFLGEPIRDKPYSEKDAFNNFIHRIDNKSFAEMSIGIRPHPSMTVDHYQQLILEFPELQISITADSSLAEDLSDSNAVVGCNSMALVIASLCHIPSYCAVPDPFKSELPSQQFSPWKDHER